MANGSYTFKHAGRTYGLEAIFSLSEARDETYSAFGKQTSFLTKLLKLGFVVSGNDVYHPDHWEPIPKDERTGLGTHRFRSVKSERQGRADRITRKR